MTNCAKETPLTQLQRDPEWESLLPTDREELLHGGRELFRQMIEAAAQQKADAAARCARSVSTS